MSDEAFNEAPAEDKHHFIRCGECGVMYDKRDLDEVMFHNCGHVHRPDMPLKRGKKIG